VKLKVLLIGSGGREHALAWKLSQSLRVSRLFCVPGNPGMARLPKTVCVPHDIMDFAGLRALIDREGVSLAVVGPEGPLAAGIVDALSVGGNRVFGPTAAAARLEGSKSFAKEFMTRWRIPTAAFAEFTVADAALEYVKGMPYPLVIKADGLAAGKGVVVAREVSEAVEAIQRMMVEGAFGEAGSKIIVEEFLEGEEASVLAFCDGDYLIPMPACQDHKAAWEGDTGPNTGGMGAYSPAPVATTSIRRAIFSRILQPCLQGMAQEGAPYRGVLYAGVMITKSGPKVVEFNCRFGDPETQVILPRMDSDLVPVLEACCASTLERTGIDYSNSHCVTVVLASEGYPGSYETGHAITGIEEAEKDPNVWVFHAGTTLRDETLVTNGGRVLNVTARGETLALAVERAYAAADKINFQGKRLRRDIAHRAL
jgi:phosphoribosylamine--glycine ligase